MAVTRGHGNPKWTREETILALNLYFECEGRIPSGSDPRVQALSETLRAFPHHSFAARKASFRNPDGVAFKLQNLRQVATGKGLGNVSRTDREVWKEFGSDPERVKAYAQLIATGIEVLNEVKEEPAEYEVFAEGRILTETHIRRERDPRLRSRLIEKRRADSALFCEICERKDQTTIPELADAIFEAHHIQPLALGQERQTKLSDLALLCACCHKLIHRAIAIEGKWLSIVEAKSIIYRGS